MYKIMPGFDEGSGLNYLFEGANIRKKKKLANFVYNAVEGFVSEETALETKYLSQLKDTLEYGMRFFISVLDAWAYLIMEKKMLMYVRSLALTAQTLNSEGKQQM